MRFIERKSLTPPETLRGVEGALILAPTFDDPTSHLRFQVDGRVSSERPEGKATVKLLDLNCSKIIGERHGALRAFARQLSLGDITARQGTNIGSQ